MRIVDPDLPQRAAFAQMLGQMGGASAPGAETGDLSGNGSMGPGAIPPNLVTTGGPTGVGGGPGGGVNPPDGGPTPITTDPTPSSTPPPADLSVAQYGAPQQNFGDGFTNWQAVIGANTPTSNGGYSPVADTAGQFGVGGNAFSDGKAGGTNGYQSGSQYTAGMSAEDSALNNAFGLSGPGVNGGGGKILEHNFGGGSPPTGGPTSTGGGNGPASPTGGPSPTPAPSGPTSTPPPKITPLGLPGQTPAGAPAPNPSPGPKNRFQRTLGGF